MNGLTLEILSGAVFLSALASILALIIWARLSRDPDQARRSLLIQSQMATVFLFDGLELVDCTPPARRIFEELPPGGSDFERFTRSFASRYPGLPDHASLAHEGFHAEFPARNGEDPSRLCFDIWSGYVRVTLTDHEPSSDYGIDDVTLAHQGAELSTLRGAANEAPFLIWQVALGGQITWANEAYLQQAQRLGVTESIIWPPRPIFDEDGLPQAEEQKRLAFKPEVGEPVWFDISAARHGEQTLYFGTAAEATMQAEATQKDFVQTLTKTFAHLSIGLAIFDKKRQLALFNPALLDIMQLPIEFLSQRPTLQRFMDRLREEKLMAEPKDYQAWRKQMSQLEAQAQSGTYCETWPLPGGLTLRVTGRPHPDGAIAFLFEDISAELALTRRFHSQIAIGREIADAMDEAVAVFSDTGALTFTNRAYRDLWDCDPESSVIEHSMQNAVALWRDKSVPGPVWDAILAAGNRGGGSTGWHGEGEMRDGRHLNCRVARLSGGATLIGFKAAAPLVSAASKLAERRRLIQTELAEAS
ncbi:MAG: PAS-domain containing protein [Pseudomonadota bacterium]